MLDPCVAPKVKPLKVILSPKYTSTERHRTSVFTRSVHTYFLLNSKFDTLRSSVPSAVPSTSISQTLLCNAAATGTQTAECQGEPYHGVPRTAISRGTKGTHLTGCQAGSAREGRSLAPGRSDTGDLIWRPPGGAAARKRRRERAAAPC